MAEPDDRKRKDDPKAERLKAALRDNLRRRKDQSRARADAERPDPAPETPSSSFGHEKPYHSVD